MVHDAPREADASGTAGAGGGTGPAGAGGARGPAGADRGTGPAGAGNLLDFLNVAAVVVDTAGRIVFWSPQATDVFGYTAEEALGRYAARLLLGEEDRRRATELFATVMGTGQDWAGTFPVRHRDGGTRLVEFRNVRLQDDLGDVYALGIAVDQSALHDVEGRLAISEQLVSQAPVGFALLDADLRYRLVNPALERINGVPAAEHLGRRPRDIHLHGGVETIESALRHVLATGSPLVDQYIVGRTRADPDHDHAWSVSYYRIHGPAGRVIGVASSVVDVTERHLAAAEAERARKRLALLADASARIGTTLGVERTARELAEVAVPDLADVAAVDILDDVLACRVRARDGEGPELFRALAVTSAFPTEVTTAADPVGEVAAYGPDRLITRCVRTGQPVLVARCEARDLRRIARDTRAAEALARAGAHSYLAVPLIAHGETLGAVDLLRTRNPAPFDEDDVLLVRELAARAAIAIGNARWHQYVRTAAETLQRSLLPPAPPKRPGLRIASLYRPAQSANEVGGDWYDVIPLADDKTALVIGDVMGNGIDAAAAMGQLCTAARAYAALDLPPDDILRHLDRLTHGLEHYIATCLYATYDPRTGRCRVANAGHLPPVLARPGREPRLLRLPPGAPLGVGGVGFDTVTVDLHAGDRLLLYTDGLVETRNDPIDERLGLLLRTIGSVGPSLDATCARLVDSMRRPEDPDDVALLLVEAQDTALLLE
ncbi:SpoIIE family protein phosphatase [Streptomyces sp. V2I9]|uniref:SpoIIE family protein phosphatase n=1 Tax=Streptomyces sp. V2I9 TaxID=3042304 RepID=UPI0027844808|nr:SpoIIE family protein phosphatase [Streptomyces sp. V2I9]MDQ0983261.1 PAS domain S-box-containing protein [Streptomyces sp. V2I9]